MPAARSHRAGERTTPCGRPLEPNAFVTNSTPVRVHLTGRRSLNDGSRLTDERDHRYRQSVLQPPRTRVSHTTSELTGVFHLSNTRSSRVHLRSAGRATDTESPGIYLRNVDAFLSDCISQGTGNDASAIHPVAATSQSPVAACAHSPRHHGDRAGDGFRQSQPPDGVIRKTAGNDATSFSNGTSNQEFLCRFIDKRFGEEGIATFVIQADECLMT